MSSFIINLSRFLILFRIFYKVAQLLGILASAVFTAVSETNTINFKLAEPSLLLQVSLKIFYCKKFRSFFKKLTIKDFLNLKMKFLK